MNVYIASNFENKKEVRKLRLLLELAGHGVTYDWTYEDADAKPMYEVEEYRKNCAIARVKAIVEAPVIIFLAHNTPMLSAMTEVGIAIGAGKPVIAVSSLEIWSPKNPLFVLPSIVHVEHLDSVVDFITGFQSVKEMMDEEGPLPDDFGS